VTTEAKPAVAELKPPPAQIAKAEPPPIAATQAKPAAAAPPSAPPAKTAASAPPAAAGAYFVQLGRGPSKQGAHRALAKARKALGAQADGLTDATEFARVGRHRRYTARLNGFPTAEAADAACHKLVDAGQTCFSRPQS
jgi:hypothetical protein